MTLPALKNAIGWYDAQDESTVEANGALSFVAANEQYLEIDQVPVTAYPFSLACWFKTTDTNIAMLFLGDKDSSVEYMTLGVLGNKLTATRRNASVGSFNTQSVLNANDNVWHFGCAVLTSDNSVDVYLDGASAVNGGDTVVIGSTYNRWSIGRIGRSTPFNYMNGDIAQSAIWNVALTPAQVASLYNAGVMVPFEDVLQPTAHWYLNDPAPPYVDSAGTLDLGAFGATGTPTPTKGPNATPAVASSSVSSWLSSSESPNDLGQDIRTKQPVYIQVPWADGFRWAIRGDGIDDSLATPLGAPIAQPLEYMAVVRLRTPLSNVTELIIGDNGLPDTQKRADNSIQLEPGTGPLVTTAAEKTTEIWNGQENDTNSKLVRNAREWTGGSGLAAKDNLVVLARNSNADFPSATDMFAYAHWQGLLSTENRQAVEGYFRSEYLLYWGDPADANSYRGPAGWWSASSIGNKADETGTGNDVTDGQQVKFLVDTSGTNTNVTESTLAPTFVAQDAAFGNASSIAFNGTDSRLRNQAFPAITNATIIAVVRMDSQANQQAFIDLSNGLVQNTGINLFYTSNTLTFRVVDGTGNRNVTAALSAGAHILIATYDGATMNLYIDGEAVAGTQTAGALANTIDTVTLGNLASGSTAWALDGAVAESQVFGRALTLVEINRIAQDLASRHSLPWTSTASPAPATLVSATVGPTVVEGRGAGEFAYSQVHTFTGPITASQSPYAVTIGTTVNYDASTGNITFNLPSTPQANDWVVLKNQAGMTNNQITVDPQGQAIEIPDALDSPVIGPGAFTVPAFPYASYRWVFFDSVGWLLDNSYRPSVDALIYDPVVATSANSPYDASDGLITKVDASGGAVDVKTPSSGSFGVFLLDATNKVTVTAPVGQTIWPYYNVTGPQQSIQIWGNATYYEWIFDPADDMWRPRGHELYDLVTAPKTSADSPYQTRPSEVVTIDLTSGSMTAVMPATALLNYASRVSFYNIESSPSNNLLTIQGNGNQIQQLGTGAMGVDAIFGDTIAMTYFWNGTDWRILSSASEAGLIQSDSYVATPIAGQATGTQTIQWTFTPNYTGDVERFGSMAAGVYTFNDNRGLTLTVRLDLLFRMNMLANNSEVVWDVTPAYTGTGNAQVIAIHDAFQSSRAWNPGPQRTKTTASDITPAAADTISFPLTVANTSGNLDLVAGRLTIEP